ncbi:MAG: hypothetical protein JNM21_15715 [Taibaiella sp.]|nr:hypothetical protein [Taibaiella sp.]
MKKILMIGVVALLGLSGNIYAQGRHNFENELRRQRNRIELARRNGAVTPKEYDKLLKEQHAIRNAIHKARRDGYIDAGEAKSIRGKLDRSAHRLRKYRTNNEY